MVTLQKGLTQLLSKSNITNTVSATKEGGQMSRGLILVESRDKKRMPLLRTSNVTTSQQVILRVQAHKVSVTLNDHLYWPLVIYCFTYVL